MVSRWSSMSKHQVLHNILNKTCVGSPIFGDFAAKQRSHDSHRYYSTSDGQRQRVTTNGRGYDTHYDVLGIGQTATRKEIKSAYYQLSKACHPDVSQSSSAKQQFQEITDAYDVLANKQSRREYDLKIGIQYRGGGSPLRHKTIYNTGDKNQENLDAFRDFNKFSDRMNGTEDYTQTHWRKRQTIRKDNSYNTYESSKRKQTYEDPLRYDPNEYFKDHFNEDQQQKYSQQIDKRDKQMNEEWRRHMQQSQIKGAAMIAIMVIFGAILAISEFEPSITLHSSQSDGQIKNKPYFGTK